MGEEAEAPRSAPREGRQLEMMPYGWHDGGWGILLMLLSWSLIVALVWAALRSLTRDDHRRTPLRDAKDLLAERFAKGEIDAEEYHERLRVLDEELRTPKTSR
jgi:putative membrane protein